jgi:hypothetical protein
MSFPPVASGRVLVKNKEYLSIHPSSHLPWSPACQARLRASRGRKVDLSEGWTRECVRVFKCADTGGGCSALERAEFACPWFLRVLWPPRGDIWILEVRAY